MEKAKKLIELATGSEDNTTRIRESLVEVLHEDLKPIGEPMIIKDSRYYGYDSILVEIKKKAPNEANAYLSGAFFLIGFLI